MVSIGEAQKSPSAHCTAGSSQPSLRAAAPHGWYRLPQSALVTFLQQQQQQQQQQLLQQE
jgi:hypothetical protein